MNNEAIRHPRYKCFSFYRQQQTVTVNIIRTAITACLHELEGFTSVLRISQYYVGDNTVGISLLTYLSKYPAHGSLLNYNQQLIRFVLPRTALCSCLVSKLVCTAYIVQPLHFIDIVIISF